MDKELSISFADLKDISDYSDIDPKISGSFFNIADHEAILNDIWLLFKEINLLNADYNNKDGISSKKLFDIYLMLCKEIESYKMKSNADEMSYENKIPIIDKYMRMFFDSLIFTEVSMPKFPLVSKVEQDIIEHLLGKAETAFNMEGSIEVIEKEISDSAEKINKADREDSEEVIVSTLSSAYKQQLQMKKRFIKITHIGLMRYQKHNFILAFDFSEIKDDKVKLKAKSSLMKMSLLIASGALQRKHNREAN